MRLANADYDKASQVYASFIAEPIARWRRRSARSRTSPRSLVRAGLLVLAALLASVALSFWLARVLTRPLLDLVGVMERVRQKGDYEIRAHAARPTRSATWSTLQRDAERGPGPRTELRRPWRKPRPGGARRPSSSP